MVKIDFSNASIPNAATSSNIISSIIDKTGVLLPLIFFSWVILAFIYHDRLVFTKPNRPNMTVPSGALPLIGHTYTMVKQGARGQFERMHMWALKSPNHVVRFTILGQGSVILANRPEYLEWIQKTNFENYPKGIQFRHKFRDVLGLNGIFVADGETWRSQRKMASHMFSARQFNTWVQSVIHNELDVIDGLLDNVASRPSGTVAMPDLFFRYTLSSFSKMAFSADLNCLSSDPSSLDTPVPFAVAFDFAQNVINERFVLPGWDYWEMFSSKGRKMRESIKVLNDFARGIIEERLAESQREKKSAGPDVSETTLQNNGKDLLGFFMEHTKDPEDLLVVVLNFIIAGRDTTAQTLSWLFYELAAHPEHVDIIRNEVEQALGTNATSENRWLRVEDMKKLPYTLATMHEAIRLHPPVPKNGKQVLKDDIIMPQGPNPYNLPPLQVYAGELIGWSDWVMNRLEEVWGPDAAEFNPTRFLAKGNDGEWVYVQQSHWKFHVFNAGPRLCLGMNLANYETLAFLAATLPKYDFTWATKQQGQTSQWPPTYQPSVTHPMQDSYLCTVKRR